MATTRRLLVQDIYYVPLRRRKGILLCCCQSVGPPTISVHFLGQGRFGYNRSIYDRFTPLRLRKKSNNSTFRSFSLRGSTYWNESLYIFIIIILWPCSILGLIDWEYMSIGLWKPPIICSFYSFLRRGLQEKEGDICVSQTSLDFIIVFQNSFPYRTKKINIFAIWHHLNINT